MTAHKPCPWCGTTKHLEHDGLRIYCDNCGCQGPTISCRSREPYEETKARAWEAWDELRNGNAWEDYEEKP